VGYDVIEKKVGYDVSEEATEGRDEKRRNKVVEVERDVAKSNEYQFVEGDKLVVVTTGEQLCTGAEEDQDKKEKVGREELEDKVVEKFPEVECNWKKAKASIPVKHVPYPHEPSRKEVELQFIRFTKILRVCKLTFHLLRHYNKCLLMLVLGKNSSQRSRNFL